MAAAQALLTGREIRKPYGGVEALGGIDFAIDPTRSSGSRGTTEPGSRR